MVCVAVEKIGFPRLLARVCIVRSYEVGVKLLRAANPLVGSCLARWMGRDHFVFNGKWPDCSWTIFAFSEKWAESCWPTFVQLA